MDWRYNVIWWDQISKDDKVTWRYDEKGREPFRLADERYLTTWRYKMKGNLPFEALPASEKVLYLELNSANVTDFRGIDNFTCLKRLEMHYCVKLKGDTSISALQTSLEMLHINQSKKLHSVEEISKLSELRVLRLNACGALPNIQFISKLPKLVDFRFVDTNILDGDLMPILEHPSLQSVGFLNKRHYNYTSEQIDESLHYRDTEESKDFANKGEFQTFRYKALGQ